MNRDELMGVIASAIFDYGREIYPGDGNLGVAEVILDAVEPIIRADERDHTKMVWEPVVTDARRALLADLRAKVLEIPAHAVRMEYEWVNGVGWLASDRVIDTVPVASVLRLLDEVQP